MRYAVQTLHGSLVATNGEVYKPNFFGPTLPARLKLWKTRKGAERAASKFGGRVLTLRPDGTLENER